MVINSNLQIIINYLKTINIVGVFLSAAEVQSLVVSFLESGANDKHLIVRRVTSLSISGFASLRSLTLIDHTGHEIEWLQNLECETLILSGVRANAMEMISDQIERKTIRNITLSFHDDENTYELREKFTQFILDLANYEIDLCICSYNMKFVSRAEFRTEFKELLQSITYYETSSFFYNPNEVEKIHSGVSGCLSLINKSP